MVQGQHDTWTGWVDMKPIVQERAEDLIGDADNGGSGRAAAGVRLQLDLRFAPMNTWVYLGVGLLSCVHM